MNKKNFSVYTLAKDSLKLDTDLKRLVSVHPNYDRADHMTGYYYSQLTALWLKADELIENVIKACSGIEFNGENPATYCLLNSINTFGALLAENDKAVGQIPDHEKICFFLTNLIQSFVKTAHIEMVKGRTERVWSTLDDRTISEVSSADCELKIANPVQQDFLLAYEKLVPINIKIAMKRFNHETTIMAGTVDNFNGNRGSNSPDSEQLDARCG